MKPILLADLSGDRVELALARAFQEMGLEVGAIVHPYSKARAWCRRNGIPHIVHTFQNRFEHDAVALYRDILNTTDFGIVHCFSSRALSTALMAVRKMKSPVKIVGYRGTMGHLHRWDPASKLSYLNPRVDAIVCVSDAVRRYLKSFQIPDERLDVIRKGHDPAWYSPAPRSALGEFGIPLEALTICFVGNIRPVKGVVDLLEAYRGMDSVGNIHLLLIGEIRDSRITGQIGSHPHIHFPGYRADAPALAGACDITVMPSIKREGLPKAILEAMAQGVPPVVTDVGGMPELVENGISGLIVPPRNPQALRKALQQLAGDIAMRHRLGAAARERINGPFHIRHTIDKTLALYRRLLTGPETLPAATGKICPPTPDINHNLQS